MNNINRIGHSPFGGKQTNKQKPTGKPILLLLSSEMWSRESSESREPDWPIRNGHLLQVAGRVLVSFVVDDDIWNRISEKIKILNFKKCSKPQNTQADKNYKLVP